MRGAHPLLARRTHLLRSTLLKSVLMAIGSAGFDPFIDLAQLESPQIPNPMRRETSVPDKPVDGVLLNPEMFGHVFHCKPPFALHYASSVSGRFLDAIPIGTAP